MPTKTSLTTNCSKSFPKGWVEHDDCGSSGDRHRGTAQGRRFECASLFDQVESTPVGIERGIS
jgi:hypothetical protein